MWSRMRCRVCSARPILRYFSLLIRAGNKIAASLCDLSTLQRKDPELSQVIERLERKEPDPKLSLFDRVLHCKSRFDRKRKVAAAVPMLFYYYHTSPLGGHIGLFTTIQNIQKIFIWKGMDNVIRVSCGAKLCVG
jgi:hypothetical protein